MAGAHDGMTPPAAALNVAISTDEEQPLGLLALVNSTLSHTASLAPGGRPGPCRPCVLVWALDLERWTSAQRGRVEW